MSDPKAFLLALAVTWLSWTPAANAGLSEVDRGPLAEAGSSVLPFAPSKAVYASDESAVFLIGGPRRGGGAGTLMVTDVSGDARMMALDHAPNDVAYDPRRDVVFVVGSTFETGMLSVHDPRTLAPLAMIEVPGLEYPSVTVSDDGSVHITSVAAGRYGEPLRMVEVLSRGNGLSLELVQSPYFYSGTPWQVWESPDEETLFVTDGREPRFWAIPRYKGTGSGFGYKSDSAVRGGIPFSASGTVTGSRTCRDYLGEGTPTTFVVADFEFGKLLLVQFDPFFGGLDILAEVRTHQDLIPGSDIETFIDSRLVVPPMLVAANCDKSMILVGNRYSGEVIQFAGLPGGRGFEKIQSIELGEAPAFVAVSPSGHEALVGFQGSRRFVRLVDTASPEAAIVIETVPAMVRGLTVQSDEALVVRDIQRILVTQGYQIGAIDGIPGPRTNAALSDFSKRYDIELDQQSPEVILEKMKDLFN